MTYNLQPSYPNVDALQTIDKALNVLYGRRTTGELVPINIDDDGRIVIGTGIVLSASDIRLGAMEIIDNDSEVRADVVRIGDPISLPPYGPTSDNYAGLLVLGRQDGGNALPLSFDASGALKVTLTAAGINSYNQFGSAVVAANGTETVIATIPVGPSLTNFISGLIAWGDVDAEYIIKVDGTQVAGGRTSAATPTLMLNFVTAPLSIVGAPGGKVITVSAKQYTTAGRPLNINIFGSVI